MNYRSNIKFSNKNQTDFVKELRSEIKTYFTNNNISRYADHSMVLKTIFMFSLYLLPYFLMVTGVITHPLIMLFLWITMGFGMAGIGFSVMHDANHRSYSKNRHVNKVLSYSLYLLGGFPANWQYQHNTLHHGFTNIDGHDEDINPGKILRFSPSKPRENYHRFQHWYAWFLYGLMTITWTINKDFKQLYQYNKEGVFKKSGENFRNLLLKLIISKTIYYSYILVIPILVLPVPWWTVLLYYFSMHYVCGFFLGIVFQTAHVMPDTNYPVPDKNGNIENNWAIHQLQTTTNYSPKSSLFSWFIGGLNYQVEHHLFPNICHIHYKKISPIVRNVAEKYQIPYLVQPNFPRAIKAHYEMLKFLGEDSIRNSADNSHLLIREASVKGRHSPSTNQSSDLSA